MKKTILLSTIVFVLGGCFSDNPVVNETIKEEINKTHASQTVTENNQTTSENNNTHPLTTETKTLEEKIGTMLMVGFMGTEASEDSQICHDIKQYGLGGVILFDVNPTDASKPKNFETKEQVAKLTEQLQACSKDKKLLIAVDQEGGKVQRLKSKYGFKGNFLRAKEAKCLEDNTVKKTYEDMASELEDVGINYNLAPVVDLAINPKNYVIYQLGRSFGSNLDEVVKYSSIFVDAMRQHHIITALKHFPGHGSSLGDTHKGFVDVTDVWKKTEIKPYNGLMVDDKVDTVMVAHVFNKTLDDQYPATLSEKTVNGLLRGELEYDGVVITDDLQMGAIANKYGLAKTLELAINAGDDILLFGNQLSVKSMVSTKELVGTIKAMVKSGEIDEATIEKSNERIEKLKQKI